MNLKLIYRSTHSLTLLKKILSKQGPIIGAQLLFNFKNLLQTVGLINQNGSIFDYSEALISEKPYISMKQEFLGKEFELNRMIKKLIKHILDLEGHHEFDISKIDTSDTSETILTIPQQEVPQEFIEKFMIRKEQILKASDQR